MSRSLILKTLYSLLGVFTVIVLLLMHRASDLEVVDKFSVSYSPNTTGVAVYEMKSTNTMKCNLTAVNTIVENMILEDFFYIESDKSEDYLLDIVLSNGEEQYRLLYNRRTRDFMCLSNPFLKNYIPMTYIHG